MRARERADFRQIPLLAARLAGAGLVVALASTTAASDPGSSASAPTEGPRVQNLKALSALPRNPRSAVVRDGFAVAGDAPPLAYISTDRPCPIVGGDGGSQVPTSDGGCWVAQFDGPPDAREWGQSYPFTMHVSSTGSDGGGKSWCFTACATVQQAVTQACKMNFRGRYNVVTIDGVFSGPGFSISGECPGQGGPQASGQYLYVQGTLGSGSVALTAAAGRQVFNVEASSGALLLVRKLTLSVAPRGYGLFAQNAGTVVEVGDDVKVTGARGAAAGLYAEGLAQIELATGQRLTLQGEFANPLMANTGALVEFDPGPYTIDCGSGLTIPSGGGFLSATLGGHLMFGPTAASNCDSVTGDPVLAWGGAQIVFTHFPALDTPGNGFVRLFEGGSLLYLGSSPIWRPSLGACANGTLAGEATNYDFVVTFSGPNSSCAVLFGKPANAKGYFAGRPVCLASTDTGGAGPTVGFASLSNLGFTAIPSLAFANRQLLQVHCSPVNGG